jgi:hypothetical protein
MERARLCTELISAIVMTGRSVDCELVWLEAHHKRGTCHRKFTDLTPIYTLSCETGYGGQLQKHPDMMVAYHFGIQVPLYPFK